MQNKLDWSKFQNLFHESWHLKMQEIIENEEVYNIFQELKNSREKVLPESKNLFRVFKETDLNNIKTVCVAMDPYPWIKNNIVIADGIPMSCSNSQILQPSLEQWYTAISNEYEEEIYKEPDLTYLLKQGFFLINSSLTVKLNKVGSMSNLWIYFMQRLFEDVLSTRTGIPYWLLGKESLKVEPFINPMSNYIFKSSHPASASHRNSTWSSDGMFKKINKIIKENFGEDEQIIWDAKVYNQLVQGIPF